MKPYILGAAAIFLAAALLPAEESPHRTAEFGFDLDAGYANGLVTLGDIFNVRRALTLAFDKTTMDDLAASIAADADIFININIGKLGFGLSAGIEASGQAKAENLLRFLREGNNRNRAFSGDGYLGGGVFFEAGLSARFPVDRFRISVRPALYVPLFYMPPPSISYRTNMDGGTGEISLEMDIDMDIYSFLPLGSFRMGEIPLGADLGGEVLWLFLPRLDLGVRIGHIPVVPATIRNRTHIWTGDYSWKEDNLFGALSDGTFEIPSLPDFQTSYDSASLTVLRPLRFDFFAEYRLLPETNTFVFRPSIGLSFLTSHGSDQVCVNFDLEGQLNLFRIFSLKLSTGLDEWVWLHRLALMFNFHAVELRLALSLRGTDFLGSWRGRGLGLSLGMSFGW